MQHCVYFRQQMVSTILVLLLFVGSIQSVEAPQPAMSDCIMLPAPTSSVPAPASNSQVPEEGQDSDDQDDDEGISSQWELPGIRSSHFEQVPRPDWNSVRPCPDVNPPWRDRHLCS